MDQASFRTLSKSVYQWIRSYPTMVIGLGVALTVVAGFESSGFRSQQIGEASIMGNQAPSTTLIARPATAELGLVPAGRATTRAVTVFTRRPTPVRLESVKTSCSCVVVAGLPRLVEPNTAVDLEVTLDASKEPDFRGRLSIDLLGQDERGETLFRAKLHAEVVPPDDRGPQSLALSDGD